MPTLFEADVSPRIVRKSLLTPSLDAETSSTSVWTRETSSSSVQFTAVVQADIHAKVWRSRLTRIEKTPGVCGGAARIVGTRIPVWTIARFRQLGATDEELRHFYPALTATDLDEARAYELQYPDEIAAQILQNET